ncbi:MAG: family 16 glycoside hydrolase [Adhaeribacter sp.]
MAQNLNNTVTPEALPYESISLKDLKAFRSVKKKQWHLAGEVFADRKKEKHLESKSGTGILVYQPQQKNNPLQTKLQHGDLDLELDFLLAKGTTAAIALQGIYLVNLKDSWLQNNLTASDCGGISAGNGGAAPAINATKAPGLWQHLRISFKAPRFDANGKKIADARLVEVSLNGKVVQQNVTLTGPIEKGPKVVEKAAGPLMLWGGNGPAAFRNIQYKTYAEQRLVLSTMQYQLHKGRFRDLNKLPTTTPIRTGKTDSLSHRIGDENELLIVEGEIEAPRAGEYLFRVTAAGPTWIYLDNKLILDNKGSRDMQRFFYGGTNLTAGKHPFKLIFSNHDRSLVVQYEGPNIPWTTLTTPASKRHISGEESLIYQVKKEPVLQRGFMKHQQGTNTYAAAVGIPGGVNFAYDLNAYTPLSAWHGGYLDVGHMWVERGEKQLAQPLGPELQLSGLPTITFLKEQNIAWPDTIHPDKSPFVEKGYKLRPNGLPVFFYALPNVSVEDYLAPTAGQEGLTREITVKSGGTTEPVYLLLASGRDIQQLPNGAYAVNDKSYYLEDIQAGNSKPLLRTSNGQSQLILPLSASANNTQVKYSIIW